MTIKHYLKYRDVILQKVRENSSVRGYRSRIGDVLGIQRSYYSLIMKGSAELTADHASLLADFWRLDPADAEYFIELVNWQRATTEGLKARLAKNLEKLRGFIPEDSIATSGRRAIESDLAVEYFGNWHVVAVHTNLILPGIDTVDALAARLELSKRSVRQALDILIKMNIAVESKGIYTVDKSIVVKPPSLQVMSLHREDLRKKGSEIYRSGDTDSIFYSGTFVLSKDLYHRIKAEFREQIDKIASRAENSKCEEAVVLFVDLFKLGRT